MAKGDLTITLNEKEYNELQRKMEGLSGVDKGQVIQTALKKGMEVIVSQGKANLNTRNKKKTGNLSSSFGVQVKKKRKASYGGFKRPKGAAAHLVDRGTEKRWTKKGYYRGSVSKNRPNTGSMFWTDAVESKGNEAVNTLMDAVHNEISRIMNR